MTQAEPGFKFGIGCFNFEPTETVSSKDEWEAAVRAGLSPIAAIDSLEFEIADPVGTHYQGWRPAFGSFTITLGIPERVQEEVNPIATRRLPGSERFVVRTCYSHFGPVTYIVCGDRDGDSGDPSTAVVIVREFLRRELARLQSGLEFSVVGPSPFHADFRLRLIADDAITPDRFDVTNTPSHGYATVQLTFAGKSEGLSGRALLDVMYRFQRDLSLYYAIVRAANWRNDRADEIEESMQQLIEMHRRGGLRGSLNRVFRAGPRARDLALDVLSAELAEREQSIELGAHVQRTADLTPDSIFLKDLRDELQQTVSSRLKAAGEAAKLLEGSRSKEFEILILGAATVLGGIAGAVASVISG